MTNNNWKKAKAYFISTGEWYEGCVMHHKDPNLKINDFKRYQQWNPYDLVIMSDSDHRKFHASLREHTEESNMKASVNNIGKHGLKPGQEHGHRWGKTHTEESKEKNRQAHLGKVTSEETKKKLSEAGKGRIHSEETKLKMSLAASKRWAKRKEQNAITVSD